MWRDRQSLGGFSALKSDLDSINRSATRSRLCSCWVAVMMSLEPPWRAWSEEDRSLIGTYVGLGLRAAGGRARATCCSRCSPAPHRRRPRPDRRLPRIPAFLLGRIARHVCDTRSAAGIRLAVRLARHRAVRGRRAHIATIYACVQEMSRRPPRCCVQKAPRACSRILLEPIRPVWNRMGFLSKSDRAQHFPLQVAPHHDGPGGVAAAPR